MKIAYPWENRNFGALIYPQQALWTRQDYNSKSYICYVEISNFAPKIWKWVVYDTPDVSFSENNGLSESCNEAKDKADFILYNIGYKFLKDNCLIME